MPEAITEYKNDIRKKFDFFADGIYSTNRIYTTDWKSNIDDILR